MTVTGGRPAGTGAGAEPPTGGIHQGPTSYGDPGFSRFVRSVFLASAGYDDTDTDRPIIGVGHTISDFTPCHREMPALVDAVKRGVVEAGGVPMVFPTMSLGEVFLDPTSMMFRNLLALEVEELLRAQPMDAAVLLGGCDKTVPGQLMGAVSAGRPALEVVAGPMIASRWRGERVGACTDCRRLWAGHRAGAVSEVEIEAAAEVLAPTGGTCMVMGTASTLAIMTEVLGLAVPGSATAPAPSGDRLRVGTRSGRRIVAMAHEGLTPLRILTRASFLNAAVVLGAVGGSTNAVVHLLALAGRAGVDLSPAELGDAAASVPVVVDCRPTGAGFLDDLHDAGGVPALLAELASRLDLEAATALGGSLGDTLEEVDGSPPWPSALHRLDDPVSSEPSLVALFGSLAPDGAVLKAGAATPRLLAHRGPAVVFDGVEDMQDRLDRVDATADSVLVLRGCGPAAAERPEAGASPTPKRLAAAGVADMVRVSDARMSGTAFGTVVLHVAPEGELGPLGLVQDGDIIELDAEARRLDLLVDPETLRQRGRDREREPSGKGPAAAPTTRWRTLQAAIIGQADRGADIHIGKLG
ncbi:MAG: dihydroxy-acid dehydratase [Acidimicrobiaceae bacterium]|nr:dihydroxy-acid dehydratase [Acidimicrobiaceae bacterium]